MIFPSIVVVRGRFKREGAASNCVGPRLACTDADGFLDIEDENLSVADAAGSRSLLHGINAGFEPILRNDDLDLHLWQEIHDILGAAVEYGMALLPPETLGLGDCDALDSYFLK